MDLPLGRVPMGNVPGNRQGSIAHLGLAYMTKAVRRPCFGIMKVDYLTFMCSRRELEFFLNTGVRLTPESIVGESPYLFQPEPSSLRIAVRLNDYLL
jgi:hypothetical protein